MKDGKPIDESSSRYLFSSDGDKKFEVRIKSCTAGDVGQYTARAIGKKGETNAAFALNVTGPNDQWDDIGTITAQTKKSWSSRDNKKRKQQKKAQ